MDTKFQEALHIAGTDGKTPSRKWLHVGAITTLSKGIRREEEEISPLLPVTYISKYFEFYSILIYYYDVYIVDFQICLRRLRYQTLLTEIEEH